MKSQDKSFQSGPNAGVVAVFFTLMFCTGLSFVVSLSGKPPYFPGPWESGETISIYFQNQSYDVLRCAFFQFGAALPLALFTATVAYRLWLQGSNGVGILIALSGGIMTAVNLALSALILWVMAYPGIAQETVVNRALYYLAFAVGGVGYSVPLGLLILGIVMAADSLKVLPMWMFWFGILLGVIAELSWLSLIYPKLLSLIPLTRFPGFIWLIIAGFKISKITKNNLI